MQTKNPGNHLHKIYSNFNQRIYYLPLQESISVCQNVIDQIFESSYMEFQHNRMMRTLLEKLKNQQSVNFLNKNYEKMLTNYYVHHEQHSPEIKQEQCFKNTNKKYCFFSESIQKQKRQIKEVQTFVNQFQKPYIIKKNSRLKTMNQTFNSIKILDNRSKYPRLSHNVTQTTNDEKNISRDSLRPIDIQFSPLKQSLQYKKLKKMSSTLFTEQSNSQYLNNRSSKKQAESELKNQKFKTEASQSLVNLTLKDKLQYNEIDHQIDILRQRKIKLEQVVNLFDVEIYKNIKSTDRNKIQKDLINKKLNFTTNFDGTVIPILQKENILSKNENVICKIKNIEKQLDQEIRQDFKKKNTFISNQNQNKIKRKINKKFSSLIQSSKKFKLTSNQVSLKHSKQISSVQQVKFIKRSKQNLKKLRFQDNQTASQQNKQKPELKEKICLKSSFQLSKKNISNILQNCANKIEEKVDNNKQLQSISLSEVSKNTSRWERKQKLLKKIQFSQEKIKTTIINQIHQSEQESQNQS